MMTAFLAVILIIFGAVNLASDQPGLLGWLFLIVGLILLIAKLSGPSKPRKYEKGNSGGASYSQTNDCSSTDYSSGDGGGGGE